MAIYYADGSNSDSGRQIQVITATSSTYTMINSTSYANFANHYVDITPKSNGNRLIGTFGCYLNNRDNDTDSRVKFKIQEQVTVGGYTYYIDIYFPNLNEGVDSHQWISKANGSGTTDMDMWQLITLHWVRTIPSSGRAGVSHRYQLQGGLNSTNADTIKSLGFSGTVMEVTV
tara:strand:+ start:1034 stop:1552 length:519 start_codon:yes stop_codon:yes gene_type:complete